MKSEKTKAIVRLIVTVVLMINMILTIMGKNPIPFDEAALTEWLTVAAAGLSTLWSWWKNNNITTAAAEAQKTLAVLKTEFTEDEEVEVE